jgi:hypothetical protein
VAATRDSQASGTAREKGGEAEVPTFRELYRSGMSDEELLRLPEAIQAEGLREEIAALRVRLGTVFKEHPDDFRLALYGMNTLVRLVVADYRLSPRASKELSDNLAALLNQFGDQILPAGR